MANKFQNAVRVYVIYQSDVNSAFKIFAIIKIELSREFQLVPIRQSIYIPRRRFLQAIILRKSSYELEKSTSYRSAEVRKYPGRVAIHFLVTSKPWRREIRPPRFKCAINRGT